MNKYFVLNQQLKRLMGDNNKQLLWHTESNKSVEYKIFCTTFYNFQM